MVMTAEKIEELARVEVVSSDSFLLRQYEQARAKHSSAESFERAIENNPALRAVAFHVRGYKELQALSEAEQALIASRRQELREAAEREQRERYAELDRMEAVARRTRYISTIRCTDAMRDAVIDQTFARTDAFNRAEAWMNANEKPWLVLSGPTGCGKTMAAIAVAAGWRPATMVRADELVRIFWANFGDSYEMQQELRDAPLLILDDVGCEMDAARMLPALVDFLDARQSVRSYPTIVTTNLTAKALRERYASERLFSRLAELAQWEGLTSPDMRRNKTQP